MKDWTLDDIEWDRFDPSKVDPEILKIVKAAAMVERNGVDYGVYLSNVFADDHEFIELARVCGQFAGTSLELLPRGATDLGPDSDEPATPDGAADSITPETGGSITSEGERFESDPDGELEAQDQDPLREREEEQA